MLGEQKAGLGEDEMDTNLATLEELNKLQERVPCGDQEHVAEASLDIVAKEDADDRSLVLRGQCGGPRTLILVSNLTEKLVQGPVVLLEESGEQDGVPESHIEVLGGVLVDLAHLAANKLVVQRLLLQAGVHLLLCL